MVLTVRYDRTAEDQIIKGSRLSTNKQVILCFFFHQGFDSDWNQGANAIINHMLSFCTKANVAYLPIINKTKKMQPVKKLVIEMKGLQKQAIKVERRSKGKVKQKIENFTDKLSKTMKFWPSVLVVKCFVPNEN